MADIDGVLGLVQRFLEKFRPNDYWSIEWSNTCSKPRVDAFSGGAAIITAKEVRSLHISEWLSDRIAEAQRGEL